MSRPSATAIDEGILDVAAGFIAAQGVDRTSVAQIAEAAGYSKTGLLHRFPTKASLVAAVLDDTRRRIDAVVAAVDHLPPGPTRDVAVVERVVAEALDRPGHVTLALSAFTSTPTGDEPDAVIVAIANGVRAAFGDDEGNFPVDLIDPVVTERSARVAVALGGIAILAADCARQARQDGLRAARTMLTTIALDALGVPAEVR